jgi:hypothetical protein
MKTSLKWFTLWVLLGVLSISVMGQGAQPTSTPTPTPPPPVRVIIDAPSAFVRAIPSFDGEVVASLVDGDILEIVGRNLDGTWFEVKRPNRLNNLGWIFNNLYEKSDFLPELIPLRDITTGVVGPTPLTEFPPQAIYLAEGPALRTLPSRLEGTRIINIPPRVTIPVISRSSDGAWFKVNYLGYEGWIIAFTARDSRRAALQNLPIDPNGFVAVESIAVEIIPPEIQQAQLDELRAFILDRRVLAVNLESLWWRVFRGEVMPCDAPEAVIPYPYTESDVRQLPEIQRVAPRISDAIEYLRSSADPLYRCGVVFPSDVVVARDAAINARVIFDAELERLLDVEREINEFQPR